MDSYFQNIINSNTESDVYDKVNECIPNFLDDDWEDEFDDEFDAYSEQGRGEAESQVIHELIKSIDEVLTSDEECELFDKIKEHYNLNTN